MSAVDLAAEPHVQTAGYGRWQPLNARLGVDAFGLNAVVVDPGEEMDIAHDETESGQQEVYIVVAGRAAFTIGDERVEAGPGTIVAVPDPSVHRGYTALEPGTRIVCVGGAPVAEHDFGSWIEPA